jgi:hypothetical protein
MAQQPAMLQQIVRIDGQNTEIVLDAGTPGFENFARFLGSIYKIKAYSHGLILSTYSRDAPLRVGTLWHLSTDHGLRLIGGAGVMGSWQNQSFAVLDFVSQADTLFCALHCAIDVGEDFSSVWAFKRNEWRPILPTSLDPRLAKARHY